ncbi:MAG: ABC transporter substrate-binding protein [Campylobacterales bacterium]|nr:ABC transporter substrate-binding protein [Campylobacterales bacterium]
MAKEKGYYSDVGLTVEIIERNASKNNIEQVINGEAHYGVADSAIVLYRAQGKPVRVIASIFQHSPIVYLSKRGSGIVSPYEMRGKRISYQKNLNDSILVAMLQNANIGENDYTHVPLDFTAQDFIDDKVDVISVYLSDQPYTLNQMGIKFNIINPLNYGFDFYGDNLFTTDSEIDHHPQRVKRFREASLKGWQYALEHVDETIALLKTKYHATSSIDHLQYEAKMTKQLILPEMIEIGSIDPNRFYRIAKVYQMTQKATQEALNEALEEIIYNPNIKSNQWVKIAYIIGILLILALVVVWVLFLLNKRLNRLVIAKTQEQNTLLSLFEHGDSVLFKWRNDKGWSIEYVSSNVVNLPGYTKEEFITQKIAYAQCIYSDDLPHVTQEVANAKQSRNSFFKHDPYRIVTQSGEIKWVLDYTVLSRDSEGMITHFLGYLIDITQHHTIYDKLTNAYNREYFEQNYQRFINQYTQSNSHLALAILDIDYFKMVNDTYGHNVGDKVLQEFVQSIHQSMRSEDILIRWGGEEFIILLKVTSQEAMENALQTMHKAIEAKNFSVVGSKTCSIGATLYQPHETIKTTIKRADKALYQAKSNGRNCLVVL